MTELRVLTLNILMGGRRGEALHRLVREVAPDVLLVNESPKRPFVWKRQCHQLAKRWRMRFVAGGRPAGSNMIAVNDRVDVQSAHAQILGKRGFQPRRGIASAQLRVGDSLVGVVSCHLSLDRKSRLQEVERVLGVADRLLGPVVLAGDLNERPTGPSWKRLERAGFVDHGSRSWLTFPVDAPERRIDALLLRGSAGVVHHGDPEVSVEWQIAASDHRPVLAVLDFS